MKDTKTGILHAAEKLFAKYGFSGTSINDIADKIKINKSLIYHHFGSKQGLWKAVKLAIIARYDRAYNLTTFTTNKGLNVFLSDVVQNRFAFYKNNPHILRFIHWQRLESNQKKLMTEGTTYLEAWRTAITDLQQKGQIRADLNPDMIGLFINNAVRSACEESSKEYLNFIIESLYRALKK
jgi:TetR/AcrR family transcriptional regulator